MKRRLPFLLLFFAFNTYSQGTADKMIYLDSVHLETSQGNHKFYRIVKDYFSEQPLKFYRIDDYYKSGEIEMTGTSLVKEYLLPEGPFVYYYQNGNKKSSSYYKDSRPTGSYFEWYENGNPKMEGEYISDRDNRRQSSLKILEFWNADNVHTVIGGNGDYNEVTENENNYGKIKDGFKDGVWTGFSKKVNVTFSETYAKRKLVSGIATDFDNKEYPYTEVEVKAEPVKGINDFRKYISKNFKVPDVLPVGGRIISKFVIDKSGGLTDIVVVKSIGYGTDEEMIRVIKSYPNAWKPGVIRGIKVKMQFSIPINLQAH